MFVVYVMDSVNVLESLLCILRVFGVVLFFDGELLIENWVWLVNCYKINKFKLYGIYFKLNDMMILYEWRVYNFSVLFYIFLKICRIYIKDL